MLMLVPLHYRKNLDKHELDLQSKFSILQKQFYKNYIFHSPNKYHCMLLNQTKNLYNRKILIISLKKYVNLLRPISSNNDKVIFQSEKLLTT